MRAVIQRVSRAQVAVAGRSTGEIGVGLVILIGFTQTDGDRELAWMAEKITGLRIFRDEDGKMNRSLAEAGGAALVVSQFTLYADVQKGRRPSFVSAARPEMAIPLYERFIIELRSRGAHVETGEFGAMMEVELVNDGPVTIWLEK